jgi:hypothetical protein
MQQIVPQLIWEKTRDSLHEIRENVILIVEHEDCSECLVLVVLAFVLQIQPQGGQDAS